MTATLTNYSNLTLTNDATQLVDDLVATVTPQEGTMTDTFPNAGNNYTILWLLSYKVDQSAPATLYPKVTVNGAAQGVAFGVPAGPCPQFGIVPLTQSIDALITGTAPPPGPTDTLVITYPFLYEGTVRVGEAAPETAYAHVANRGVFSGTAQAGSGLSRDQAFAAVEAQLRQFATPFTQIQATIGAYYRDQGVEEGQSILFSTHRLGLLGLVALIMQAGWVGTAGYDQKELQLSMDVAD